MAWVWDGIRGLSGSAALAVIDRGLDKLQRAIYTPDAPVVLPYSTVVVPDMGKARRRHFRLTVTDGVAFILQRPTGIQLGAMVTFDIINASAGAMGAITWGGEYLFLTTFTPPGAGTRVTLTFYCADPSPGTNALIQLANQPAAGGGGGETNTGSNQNATGIGVFSAKVGVDLQFRGVAAASSKLSSVLNAGNKTVDLDVVEANLQLPNMGGQIVNAQIAANAVGTNKIAASAVTYARIQNISATDKVLGRQSAGAGDTEEIACTASGRALIAGASAVAQRTTLGLLEGQVAADQATFVNVQTNIANMLFAIAINEVWVVDWVVSVTMGTAATGVKFYFTFPVGCTGEIHYEGNVATLPTWQSLYQAVLTVPGTFFVTGIITGMVRLRTTIRNAGTAGTIQLVGITGGATTTCAVKKGSSFIARRSGS